MAISYRKIEDIFTWVAAPLLVSYVLVNAIGGREETPVETLQDWFRLSASSIVIEGYDAAVERRMQGLTPPAQPCPRCFMLDRA
jgi:hypothetical protein